MRRFRIKQKINWKYILGEIFLIFIGINLAIWFNDWNSSLKINNDKKKAIARIEDELKNNLKEVTNARSTNQLFVKTYTAYKPFFHKDLNSVIVTSDKFNQLQKEFPDFFNVNDSTLQEDGNYLYRGISNLNLELSELSKIAWETTRSINITNNFSYDCLYEIESLYNLQQKIEIQNEMLTDAIVENNVENVISILGFMGQIESQLLIDYEAVIGMLPNCR